MVGLGSTWDCVVVFPANICSDNTVAIKVRAGTHS